MNSWTHTVTSATSVTKSAFSYVQIRIHWTAKHIYVHLLMFCHMNTVLLRFINLQFIEVRHNYIPVHKWWQHTYILKDFNKLCIAGAIRRTWSSKSLSETEDQIKVWLQRATDRNGGRARREGRLKSIVLFNLHLLIQCHFMALWNTKKVNFVGS